MSNHKKYTLVGADEKPYLSEEKGALGGNRATKVYGRMDCPAALRALRSKDRNTFVQNRVSSKMKQRLWPSVIAHAAAVSGSSISCIRMTRRDTGSYSG